MASIAEMMVASGLENSTKAPDYAGAYAKGAELAMNAEKIQQSRAMLEQQKLEAQNKKVELVGKWLDDYSKMPDGVAKKTFGKKFIPTGIGALGLQDKIDPNVLEMMTGDPNLAAFLVSEVKQGNLDLSALTQPDKIAQIYAERGQQFGDLEKFKGEVTDSLPQLLKAQDLAISEEGKAARTKQLSGSKEGQRGIDNLEALRKEVTSHPITKDTLGKADAYEKIRLAFGGKPSAAGDMSGVFAYMKMLDPASTVREGEQAQAQQATGVPDQVLKLYNKAVTGETLSPTQRKDFTNRAEQLYREQYNKQQSLNGEYKRIAAAQGSNPDLIFAGTRFKAPPPEKKDFTPSANQKTVFKSATNVDKEKIVEQVAKRFNISKEAARKKLGE